MSPIILTTDVFIVRTREHFLYKDGNGFLDRMIIHCFRQKILTVFFFFHLIKWKHFCTLRRKQIFSKEVKNYCLPIYTRMRKQFTLENILPHLTVETETAAVQQSRQFNIHFPCK